MSDQLMSSIECEECYDDNRTFEQFIDLNLPLLEERPAKPDRKISVVASYGNDTNLNIIKKNKSKAQKKKDRRKK